MRRPHRNTNGGNFLEMENKKIMWRPRVLKGAISWEDLIEIPMSGNFLEMENPGKFLIF